MNGIYYIKNKINNKVYVGSAAGKNGIKERFYRHRTELKRNIHSNKYLQTEYNKYGLENFEFIEAEQCLPEKCLEREQFHMDNLQSWDRSKGYNLCKIAGNTLGRKHSKESRLKISTNRTYGPPVNKGKKHKLSSLKKMSLSQKNSPKTQAHIKKINTAKRKPVYGINVKTNERIDLSYAGADPRFKDSGIVMSCKNKIPHYKGFKWFYKQ